jgi:hypothetical protein
VPEPVVANTLSLSPRTPKHSLAAQQTGESPSLLERQGDALSTWYKIRNRNYSQMVGRNELFERDRHKEPVPGWHTCEAA